MAGSNGKQILHVDISLDPSLPFMAGSDTHFMELHAVDFFVDSTVNPNFNFLNIKQCGTGFLYNAVRCGASCISCHTFTLDSSGLNSTFKITETLVSVTRAGATNNVQFDVGTNAAASALLNIFGGACGGGGDAALAFRTALVAWRIGGDRSDGSALVISLGTALGTCNALKIDTCKNVSIPGGNLDLSRSNCGGTNALQIHNTAGSSTSDASISVQTPQACGGDAYIGFLGGSATGACAYTVGQRGGCSKLLFVGSNDIADAQVKLALDQVGRIEMAVLTDCTRGCPGTAGRVIFNSTDGNLNMDNGCAWILPNGCVT